MVSPLILDLHSISNLFPLLIPRALQLLFDQPDSSENQSGLTRYASRINAASVNNLSCLLLGASSAGDGGCIVSYAHQSRNRLTSDQKLSHPLLTVLGVAGIPVMVLQSLSSLPESIATSSFSSIFPPTGDLHSFHNRIEEAIGEAGSDLKNGVLIGGAGKAASVNSNDVFCLTPQIKAISSRKSVVG